MNDTPRTDAAYTQRPNEGAWDFKVRQEKTMESLERELTAAREELKAVTIERDEFHVKIEELAIKLQAITEQRDKLAELSGFGEFDKPIFP
jgi:predicted  nucleic acid-binding Zn-ribbon protein